MNHKIHPMNYFIPSTVALAACLAFNLQAAPPAGFVDFGKFTPPKSGEFVEVNIGKPLMSMAAKIVQGSEKEVADVLRGLERIRVNVVGLDDENRADVEKRVEEVRKQLNTDGWEPIVTVKDKGDDVGVFLKTRGEEAVEGIVVTVLEGKGKGQAVLINIVGNIQPEKLGAIGEKLDIKPLKKASAALKK